MEELFYTELEKVDKNNLLPTINKNYFYNLCNNVITKLKEARPDNILSITDKLNFTYELADLFFNGLLIVMNLSHIVNINILNLILEYQSRLTYLNLNIKALMDDFLISLLYII